MKTLLRKDFWLTGIVILFGFGSLLVYQFTTYQREADAVAAEAYSKARQQYPRLGWVFDEWERCNNGQGSYAGRGYLTTEQCDMALSAMGRKKGLEPQVKVALEYRQKAVAAGLRKVNPAWPLSLLFEPMMSVGLWLWSHL